MPETRLDTARIQAARRVIDPVFLDTPLYRCEALASGLGCTVSIKLETANPVRSFKARGTLLHHAGLVVEPSAALGIAAILEDRDRFAGRHVVTIVCGSNVDVDAYYHWVGAAPSRRS
jgi:threonine dehydratase